MPRPVEETSSVSSPIQRILIVHSNLPERCIGKPLGEGASIQELAEQILYYYHDPQLPCESILPESSDDTWKDQAVSFMGLCMALYSLPSSLPSAPQQERSQHVHFQNSTLVFVPLESADELFAVVQLQHQSSTVAASNPLGMRAAIQRQCELFGLLRGGILRRLGSSVPEMQQLYDMLRGVRLIQYKKSRMHGNEVVHDDDSGMQKLLMDIEVLRNTLPIQSIRQELDAQFREFINGQSILAECGGGIGRGLVETLPEPIYREDCFHTSIAPPVVLSSYTSVTLGVEIRKVLQDFNEARSEHGVQLLGVSTFTQGCLAHTHLAHSALMEKLATTSSNDGVPMGVPNDIVHMLMHHMNSYKGRMSGTHHPGRTQPATPRRPDFGIRDFARDTPPVGVRPTTDSGSWEDEADPVDSEKQVRGRFMPPPPESMLTAFEEAHTFGTNLQNVWALPVYLPVEMSKGPNVVVQSRTCVFELGEYCFLVFFDGDEGSPKALSTLQTKLSTLVMVAAEDAPTSDTESRLSWSYLANVAPNRDVVLIDREQHKVVVFPGCQLLNDRMKRKKSSSSRGFLSLGSRKDKKCHPSTAEIQATQLECSKLGLDCRHLLLSNLDPDTIHALDDMVQQVQQRKEFIQSSRSPICDPLVIQMCTTTTHGWVYVYVEDEKEMYTFFDSSEYTTIADLHAQTSKLREKFFGARI